MSKKESNVIQFSAFSKPMKTAKVGNRTADGATAEAVISMVEKRQAIIATERRKVKRTVLSQFLGVFILIPEKGLQAALLHDVSETGMAFDMSVDYGVFNQGDLLPMRIYLSQDTYFSFEATVANIREADAGSGAFRHGVTFNKRDPAYKTLLTFVKFLEEVSIIARKDSGDRTIGRAD